MEIIHRSLIAFSFVIVALVLFSLIDVTYSGSKIELRATTNDQNVSLFPQTIFLPWTFPFSRVDAYIPRVLASILGRPFTLAVDTGSTGVLIGAPLLPALFLTNQNKEGWKFLSNSNILHSGRFVDLNITFYGEKSDEQAVSRVPVLVVTKIVRCPGYDDLKDKGVCPENKLDRTWRKDLRMISHLGVGFGRNVPGTTSPFNTPSHNPFLNVIQHSKYAKLFMIPGYTLNTRGVYVGALGILMEGSVWTDLEKLPDADQKAWAPPMIAFKHDESNDTVQADLLIDTSTTQMYIQSAPEASMPNITARVPDPQPQLVQRVKQGTKLTFAFPDFNNNLAGLEFVVGDKSVPTQPTSVTLVTNMPKPFVNTGRNLLYKYSIAYNAGAGRFGLFCEKCKSE